MVVLFLLLGASLLITLVLVPTADQLAFDMRQVLIHDLTFAYQGNLLYPNGSQRPDIDTFTLLFNKLMVENDCCGVFNSSDFNELTLERYRAFTRIPSACCKHAEKRFGSWLRADRRCPNEPNERNSNFQSGCLPKTRALVSNAYSTLTFWSTVWIVFLILLLVFTALTFRYRRSGEYGILDDDDEEEEDDEDEYDDDDDDEEPLVERKRSKRKTSNGARGVSAEYVSSSKTFVAKTARAEEDESAAALFDDKKRKRPKRARIDGDDAGNKTPATGLNIDADDGRLEGSAFVAETDEFDSEED